jgi:nucleotide-binding universal stress UspA family protein
VVPVADAGERQTVGRIAVGIDFSEESEVALAHAAMLGRSMRAHLILLHVLPLPAHLVEDSSYDPFFRASTLSADLVARQRGDAADVLQATAGRCRDLGVSCEPLLIDDNPSDGLARAAEEVGADLLVLGSHGRAGLQRILLGSVAERAVRLCRRDALVARGPAGQHDGYRRVVIGTDFSTYSDRALRAALEVTAPDATFELVHCWQAPIVPAGMPIAPLRHDLEKNIIESGSRLINRHPELAGRASFKPLEAPPADGLATRADEIGADLIAVGSHGRRGVKRWLLGSIAEGTIRRAPCSVLVARQPGPQGTHA